MEHGSHEDLIDCLWLRGGWGVASLKDSGEGKATSLLHHPSFVAGIRGDRDIAGRPEGVSAFILCSQGKFFTPNPWNMVSQKQQCVFLGVSVWLTIADIVSVAVGQCNVQSAVQQVLQIGDVLPDGVANGEEGVGNQIRSPAEIDSGPKVLLYPLLIEEAHCVDGWHWVCQWMRYIEGTSLCWFALSVK